MRNHQINQKIYRPYHPNLQWIVLSLSTMKFTLSGVYFLGACTASRFRLILIFHCCCGLFIYQEISAQEKIKVYSVWLDQIELGYKVTGFLYDANDSCLLVSYDHAKKGFKNEPTVFSTFAAKDIGTIKLRRKGAVGKRILIGASVGIVLGGIIGFAQGDDEPNTTILSIFTDPAFTKEDKALFGMYTGAIGGSIIGALLGAVKIKIPINGNRSLYKSNLHNLKGYSYKSLR